LVDGPASGVPRHALSYRRLRVTDYKIDITRAVETGALLKIIEKIGFQKTWAASPFAKALEVRTKRSNMSDFDRFKVMLLKKQVSFILLPCGHYLIS
jgi:large subunit ribosomal protein L14e